MKYLSLFSGIEAASVAWHDFGTPVAFSEIEPFPCAVLAYHYPKTQNLGDVTKITEQQIKSLGSIDVVVFGSPCQDLSVAGKRKGMTDANGDTTRSGLFFNAIDIIGWAREHCGCRFALWENVPGAFSSNKGADFAEVVKHMAGLDELDAPANGWGAEGCTVGTQLVEWAVLDAQWFGLAQRRRRVFAVADFGDWAGRPPVLLERESLRGDTPPSREKGQGITHSTAPCLTSSGRGVERTGDTRGQDPVIAVAYGGNNTAGSINVATACNAKDRLDFESETFIIGGSAGFSAGNSSGSRGIGYTEEGTPPLRAGASGTNQVPTILSFTQNTRDEVRYINGDGQIAGALAAQPGMKQTNYLAIKPIAWSEELTASEDVAGTIQHGGQGGRNDGVMTTTSQVRRLTPKCCARLQGFPDDYLDIRFRNKPAADGNKYKALGNSMAVPVMRWIGLRIKGVLDEALYSDLDDLC